MASSTSLEPVPYSWVIYSLFPVSLEPISVSNETGLAKVANDLHVAKSHCQVLLFL